MDVGAWWATVHGVTKSVTWLSNFTFHRQTAIKETNHSRKRICWFPEIWKLVYERSWAWFSLWVRNVVTPVTPMPMMGAQRPPTSSLWRVAMKERVLFYSNWKILQVIARDPRGGQCRELLGGRGVCQEGRGPCGAGHRPLHSAEGPGRDPATHFITVYFTICELLFNSQRPLTTSVILRVFSMTTMWPQTNFSSLKFCRKENKKKGLHFFSTLKAIQFKILLI